MSRFARGQEGTATTGGIIRRMWTSRASRGERVRRERRERDEGIR
jgi:hypothetical protein